MNFNTLKSLDDSLQILKGANDFFIEEVLTPPFYQEKGLVLAKNKKFLRKVNETYSLAQKGKILLVISEKLKQEISEDQEREFLAIASVKDIEVFILPLSLALYNRRHQALGELTEKDQSIHPTSQVHEKAMIGRGVKIGKNCQIMANVTIEDGVEIGDETIIFSNVVLYSFVKVGKKCRIHSGSVIGADGFGYNFKDGVHQKIWHSGGVIIEDDVEIGALSAVDGGTFAPTLIGQGTKIDNQVQVGHNVSLGKGIILCGHVALAGSVQVGDFTVFGGFSGSGPGISIGAMSQVAGGALINCDWPEKSVLGGHPARPLKEWMKGLAYLRKVSLNNNESEKSQS